ncbi:MAG: RDD family protein [Bdellovibrionales bacterium]
MHDENNQDVKPNTDAEETSSAPPTPSANEFNKHLHLHTALASPFDRVAAFVVDHAIILIPILALILAPFKSAIAKFMYLDQLTPMVSLMSTMALFVFISVFLYHFLFLVLYGATPGRMLFNLEVVHIDPKKDVHVLSYALRTLVWMVEACMMFLPHLAIFNHYLQRPMHDRIARTVVVNTKGEVFTPHPIEMSFARGMYSAFIMLITLIFAVPVLQVGSSLWEQQNTPKPNVASNSALCEEVTEAFESWTQNSGRKANRLQVAITLFAGDEIDETCLESEAEMAFNTDAKLSTIYFAKSLVHRNQSELSDKYFDGVCRNDKTSKVCNITELLEQPTTEKWESFKKSLLAADDSQSYLKVWALQHSLRTNDFNMANALVDQLQGFPKLGGYFSGVKARALWGVQKYKESETMTSKALKEITGEQKPYLTGWICSEQLARSCSYAAGETCQNLKQAVSKERRLLLMPRVAMAHIKTNECEQGENVDYMPLIRESVLDDAQVFMMVARRRQSGKMKEYQNDLFNMMRSTEMNEVFRQEIMYRLSLDVGDRPEIREVLLKAWRESPYSLAWARTGQQLVKNYYDLGSFELAAKLGDRIISRQNSLNPEFKENLVLANYKAGRQLRAYEVLSRPDDEPASNRKIASTDEYQRVGELLNKKFKGSQL